MVIASNLWHNGLILLTLGENVSQIAWSYSSLNTFKQCPKKYFHTKVAKDVKEKQSEAIIYGNQLHEIAEKYVRDNEPIPDAFMFIKEPIDKILNKFKGDVFCEHRLGLTVNLAPCGFFDKDVWYRGVIDLLIVDGDRAVIVDYKTGKNPAYADTKQLEIMSLAVFSHFPDVKTIKSALLFLVNPALIKADFDREDKTELWAKWYGDVAQLKSCHESNVWNPMPNFTCSRFCPVESCEHNGRN